MPAEPEFDPLGILRVLNEHDVAYVVVGGFAVASYGVVRATDDLDLVIARGLRNATNLAAALAELGAHESEGGAPATPETLVRSADYRFHTDRGTLHLLREVTGIPRLEDIEREPVQVEGIQFDRPSLAALRSMKEAAGRDKDRIDLAELDALEERD